MFLSDVIWFFFGLSRLDGAINLFIIKEIAVANVSILCLCLFLFNSDFLSTEIISSDDR